MSYIQRGIFIQSTNLATPVPTLVLFCKADLFGTAATARLTAERIAGFVRETPKQPSTEDNP